MRRFPAERLSSNPTRLEALFFTPAAAVTGGAEKLSPKLQALVADDASDSAGPLAAVPPCAASDELPAAADDPALGPSSFTTPPLQVGGRRQRAQPAPTGGSRKRGRSYPPPEPALAAEVKADTRRRGTPALTVAAAASSAAPAGSVEPSFRVPSGASAAALQAAVTAVIASCPGWGGGGASSLLALRPVVTIGAPVPTHGQYAGHCAFVSLLRSYGEEGGGGGGGASSVPEELAAVMQLRRGERCG